MAQESLRSNWLSPKYRFPIWKQLLSYLYPIKIDKSEFPYPLELELDKNNLVVNSTHANQSNRDLKLAFHHFFQQIGAYSHKYNSILILGFGLGSVIELLQSKTKIYKITAIENDPRILQWLDQYYTLDSVQLIRDSVENLTQLNDQFDLIIVDVFIDDSLPEFTDKLEFWKELKFKLSPKGKLIWNTLTENQESISAEVKNLFSSQATILERNRFRTLIS